MAPVGWLGSAVVSCWLVTGKETEVTAAVTLPWVVMGVVLIGSTMLCCCWPAWIWTLGCWWMIGGVLATAAGDAIEVATIGLGAAGMPGCWALMTAVNPASLAGVPGADWVARINCVGCCCCCCGTGSCCCCWPAFPVVLVFSKRLANAWGGLEIGFKIEGLDGLFFWRHASQAATWKVICLIITVFPHWL